MPEAADFAAILEYELPREDRRPDVIVLENGTVLVIEFKSGKRVTRADVDQVRGYARDLKHYHSSCRERTILAFLVLHGYSGTTRDCDGVIVIAPDRLGHEILVRARRGARKPDASAWLRGRYAPLPGLADAARKIFEAESLPWIERAASAGIPETLARLVDIAREAQQQRRRKLVLLTGVPGSGKTLVGLQFVHAQGLQHLVASERAEGAPGVFLSGNDPLIDVLQRVLGGKKDFVRSLHAFLKSEAHADTFPPEHVFVFDEAQRAWDAKRVHTKHRAALGAVSEPELLLRVAERVPDWCVVLALLGHGQEIHVGEERGLALWADAARGRNRWEVHAPVQVAARLDEQSVASRVESCLDLDTTLRTHVAGQSYAWVNALLSGALADAANIASQMTGLDLYVTRDLDHARRYIHARYAGRERARYGMLASSCSVNLRGDAPRIKEDGLGISYGRWYEGQRGNKNFCCALETAVSEFGCQGLELDYALLCWGDDFSWTGSGWQQREGKRKAGAENRQLLRENAYRVLLTRGRDGTCIFVPDKPASAMSGIYEALVSAGVRPLVDD